MTATPVEATPAGHDLAAELAALGVLSLQPIGRTAEGYCREGDTFMAARRYEEALRAYRLALQRDRRSWHAITGHNRAIRRLVPRWHFEMMHDTERANLYDEAIRKAVRPDSLVLDIGTGSGLLSLMATRAGARSAIACEAEPVVAEVARRVIDNAGYSDRIRVVPKMSTDMRVGVDLPRRADVLVTETVDCGLLGEGVLATIAHAREHLLTEDAIIIPSRARVLAQLIDSEELQRKNHVGDLYGFDLSEFNLLSSMEYFDARLEHYRHRPLSEPFEVFGFDFRRDGADGARTTIALEPSASGTCHAIVFWFELELVDGIVLTNSATHPNTHWKQAVQCLPAPVEVRVGEPLRVDARHDGSQIHFSGVGDLDVTGLIPRQRTRSEAA